MAAFETTDLAVLSGSQLDAFLAASPIVLDLDGNGVRTLSAGNGVSFDLNASGHANKVGWASATDGLLVMDRNHDGVINDGRELFGVATQGADGTRAGTGYAAMSLEDSNHDGKLNASDAHFKDLQLWVDANHDGKTDKGELHTLAEFGIKELDLHAQTGTTVDNGNLLGLVSSYTKTDGSQHAMADVWFAKDAPAGHPAGDPAKQPPALSDVLAAPAADLLPAALGTAAATGGGAHNSLVMPVQTHAAVIKDDEFNRPTPLI